MMIQKVFIESGFVKIASPVATLRSSKSNSIKLKNTMKKLTYKEAYDKITEAYIKGEIEPYNREFCFCGTLVYNKLARLSLSADDWSYDLYNPEELRKMEYALLSTIRNQTIGENACSIFGTDPYNPLKDIRSQIKNHANHEDALFNGMCAALEVLKQIHKERGENVEDFEFVKRDKVISKSSLL